MIGNLTETNGLAFVGKPCKIVSELEYLKLSYASHEQAIKDFVEASTHFLMVEKDAVSKRKSDMTMRQAFGILYGYSSDETRDYLDAFNTSTDENQFMLIHEIASHAIKDLNNRKPTRL